MAIVNVPGISTGKVIQGISKLYINAVNKKMPFANMRASFLWGPPGVGKSDSIKQIANEIEEATGKKVGIRDIRLSNCALTDLVGIPVPDKDNNKSIWLCPEIFDFSDSDNDIEILFFDELEKAAPSVQAAALQIILDRRSWVHELPDNCILLAAGNPNRLAKGFDAKIRPELANRFRHYMVMPDFDSFREWAVKNHIHPFVLGYLSYDNSKLYVQSENADIVAFPTPRSWKNVSDLLTLEAEDDLEDVRIEALRFEIAGDVGEGVAHEFESWCKVFRRLPSTADIYRGKPGEYPTKPDILYALISSMTVYADQHQESLTDIELQNACRFAEKFPADFKTLFYRNLYLMKEVRRKLVKIPVFVEWATKNKNYLPDKKELGEG